MLIADLMVDVKKRNKKASIIHMPNEMKIRMTQSRGATLSAQRVTHAS
jgi:hypothetical protein